MTDAERERTLRVLVKRNKLRMDALREPATATEQTGACSTQDTETS